MRQKFFRIPGLFFGCVFQRWARIEGVKRSVCCESAQISAARTQKEHNRIAAFILNWEGVCVRAGEERAASRNIKHENTGNRQPKTTTFSTPRAYQ
jgi:hypothetical protein